MLTIRQINAGQGIDQIGLVKKMKSSQTCVSSALWHRGGGGGGEPAPNVIGHQRQLLPPSFAALPLHLCYDLDLHKFELIILSC